MSNTSAKRSSLAAGLAVALLFAVFTTMPAYAVEATGGRESLTVSPAKLALDSVKPGEVKTGEIIVFNDGDYDYDFRAYAESYSVSNENYSGEYGKEDDPRADLNKWIDIDTGKQFLEAGKTTKVSYKISIPQNAMPGSHTAAIMVEIVPPEQGGIVSKKRIAVAVYANVEGKTTYSGSVVDTKIPFWQQTSPLTSSVRVANTGNTYFQAKIATKLYNMSGELKSESENEYLVLPEKTRRADLQLQNAFWVGLYKAEVTTTVLDKTSTESGYVLVAPLWLVVLIPVLILSVIFRIVYARKYGKHAGSKRFVRERR